MENPGSSHSIRRILVPLLTAILCTALILPMALPIMADDAETTTLIASNPNPSLFGETVTITAIVSSGAGTPAGTVVFKDANIPITTLPLVSGSAVYSTSALSVGTHSLTADFVGDAGFTYSTSINSVTQVVTKANTNAVLISSTNPSFLGEEVTFTATISVVSPGSGTPDGDVIFRNNTETLVTKPLTGGVATYTTSDLPVATYNLTAVYNGDGNFNGSTSETLPHTVQVNIPGYVWDWGDNAKYQLGDGETSDEDVPRLLDPEKIEDITSIAGGLYHSLAVDSDGQVWVWGTNDKGQLGISTSTSRKSTPYLLDSISDVEKVAAGSYHSLVLKTDGTVWAWGYNSDGQLGIDSKSQQTSPVQVLGGEQGGEFLTNIKDIAAGNAFSMALAKDGSVYTWGEYSSGQLGIGSVSTEKTTPVKVDNGEQSGTDYLSGIEAIAAGYDFCLAVVSDGKIYAWGNNKYGALGNGDTSSTEKTPVKVDTITDAAAVAAGQYHSLAVTNTGTVYAWGYNGKGQLGVGSTSNKTTPVAVEFGKVSREIKSLAAGYNHSLALDRDGFVWGWGNNDNGQVGNGSSDDYQDEPVELYELNGTAANIAAGAYHNLATSSSSSSLKISTTSLKNAGVNSAYEVNVNASGGTKPYIWEILPDYDGATVNNILGISHTESQSYCTLQGTFTSTGTFQFIMRVSDSDENADLQLLSLKVTSSGQGEGGYIWDWGENSDSQIGNGNTTDVKTPRGLEADSIQDAVHIAGGLKHTLAVDSEGIVYAWGDNYYGQLGTGSSGDKTEPYELDDEDIDNIDQVAAGGYFSLALDNEDYVWAWGDNSRYQLGNADAGSKEISPVRVDELENIQKIAAGYQFGMALDNEGYVWTWGDNSERQLGTDSSDSKCETPDRVKSGDQDGSTYLSGIVDIAAGYQFCLAVDYAGNIWAWGDNSKGQLGNTDADSYEKTPIQVYNSKLTNAKKVAAGYDHSLALDATGIVWAWGNNEYGQLGINSTSSNKTTPTSVEDADMDMKITSIAAGYYHSMALDEYDHVWVWGDNSHYQMGMGDTDDNLDEPVEIDEDDLEGVISFIAAGANHSLAISDEEDSSSSGDIEITTTTLSSVYEDDDYEEEIEAVGGELPYDWEILDDDDGDEVNDALKIDWENDEEYCTLEGEFNTAGTYTFTVRVEDNNGDYDEKEFTIKVKSSSSSGGGSSGGGGGSSSSSTYTAITTTGFSGSTVKTSTSSGLSQSNYSLNSTDGIISLAIPKDTNMLNNLGRRLTEMSVSAVTSPPSALTGSEVVTAYSFQPDGAMFSPYITLKMNYNPGSLPANVAESSLYIANYNGTTWQIVSGQTIDLNANTVSANITHFSTYAILGTISSPSTPTPTASATPGPTATKSPTPSATGTQTPKPSATTTKPPASGTPTRTTSRPSSTQGQTQTPSGDGEDGGGLPIGAIIGIVVGVLIIAGVAILIIRKRQNL
ncbi:MAG: Ig-like domain repeat protein [Dehalococcoidales bacterium]|nr:Ig-like domain repeat protein [Dehalococcoidales bacterium]